MLHDSPPERLIHQFIARSPLGCLLDFQVEKIEADFVRLRLPFRPEVTTMADLVHGGAIAALIDAAATAAAWSGVEDPLAARGTTIGFTVNFLSGARGADVLATARVVRRGRSISTCDVDVTDAAGSLVAKALVTYKLSAGSGEGDSR